MEYIELGSLSSYLRLHEDELVDETNRLLKYSLDIAQVILYSYYIKYQYFNLHYIILHIFMLDFINIKHCKIVYS